MVVFALVVQAGYKGSRHALHTCSRTLHSLGWTLFCCCGCRMTDTRWFRSGTRHSYNTKQHRYRPVRTPGGVLKSQRLRKTTKGPRCSDCKISLPGIQHLRNADIKRTVKRERTVSRCYGGSTCHACVRQRIVRAFLLEEQKAVKKVLAERGKK